MWGVIPDNLISNAEEREQQLKTSDSFWGDMIKRGSEYSQYKGTEESGRELLKMCVHRTKVLDMKISIELGQGRTLEETSAGRVQTREIQKRKDQKDEEMRKEMEELRKEEEEARANREELKAQGKNPIKTAIEWVTGQCKVGNLDRAV